MEFTPYKTLITTDIVIFSILKGKLHILLVKRKYDPFKGHYALPGGFLKEGEELEECARRELEEETGIKDVYLKKINFYGSTKRDPRGRVITTVFMALVNGDQYEPRGGTDAQSAHWVAVADVKKLAFDHERILKEALNELRWQVQMTNIAYQMMPEQFTLTELQQGYESVLDRKLDKRNFRKRILSMNLIQETNQTKIEGAHRPAQLYRFKHQTYQPLKEQISVRFFY